MRLQIIVDEKVDTTKTLCSRRLKIVCFNEYRQSFINSHVFALILLLSIVENCTISQALRVSSYSTSSTFGWKQQQYQHQQQQYKSVLFTKQRQHHTSTGRRSFLFHSSFVMTSSSNKAVASQDTVVDTNSVYWNREYGISNPSYTQYDFTTIPITKRAKIVCLSDPNDTNNRDLYQLVDGKIVTSNNTLLVDGCEILHVGCTDLNIRQLKQDGCNVIFVSYGLNSRELLQELIIELGDQLEWIHSRSAGIDSFMSPTLQHDFTGTMTNAKGCYSSTLAEYTIMACLYFAKDLPRLLQQKQSKHWNAYPILELRGSTLGIIGFGDIGQAAGRLAVAMGMKLIALTRTRESSERVLQNFPPTTSTIQLVDTTTNPDAINIVFAKSDYILLATPLTDDTRGLIGKEQFQVAKQGSVLINVGRGPVIKEDELIEELQGYINGESHRRLKGAALDVTMIEPLPTNSLLWSLDNVLLSPHNMDMTTTFMYESTTFFIEQQIQRFIRGLTLLNPVNVKEGY